MAKIIIPALLSFFLGPGVGQLYNKEFKKGAYLIGLSLLVLIAACVWCFKASQPYLPPDLASLDPSALQSILRNAAAQVAKTNSHTLTAYQFILMALWVYGVSDAIYGGLRRQAGRAPGSSSDTKIS